MHLCFLGDFGSVHLQRWARFYAERGHRVSIISFRPGPDFPGDVFVVPSKLPGKARYIAAIPEVRRLIRSLAPDLVHAHHVTSFGLLGALAGWKPLVLTAHGSDVLISPRKSKLMRMLVAWTLNQADVVTAASRQAGKSIASVTNHQVSPEIFQYGLALNEWGFTPRRASGKPVRLISTRNLRSIYDVETAIRAMKEISLRHPGSHLTVCGDGPLREQLQTLAYQLGLQNSISFTGPLGQDGLRLKLSESDIYLSTSKSDGLAMSALEAMAVGVYPVLSDIEANRDLIDSGVHASTFRVGSSDELASVVCSTIDQRSKRNEAVLSNRAFVERYADRSLVLGALETTYRELVERRKMVPTHTPN